ncbi:MAG: beta-aspartyl-peptidase, partial [Halanaerobium sp.]|nr:beta-aspartyl-peptidase [Halanaerobium sp.]
LGRKDILLAGKRIALIADSIPVPEGLGEVTVIEADGKWVVPGFIDCHVHIIGGGGEGGFHTRTPEIQLSQLTTCGITTVIGLLGTDATTRHMTSLLAKARALDEEGITTYIMTGSYQIPLSTITGNPRDDLIIIDKVIGIGEIAISDHRSSQPSLDDVKKIVSQARVGGILSGKSGIVTLHVGNGRRMLEYLNEIATSTEIPYSQLLPTHINRNARLLESGIEYARAGGQVDLTTSSSKNEPGGAIKASKALKKLLAGGVNPEKVTFSSDGQGSLPRFNQAGEFVGLDIGSVHSLFSEVRDAILQEGIDPLVALSTITYNVARIFKLEDKGRIARGSDADLVLISEEDLQITDVIAGGQLMVASGQPVKTGTFEDAGEV